MLAKFQVRVRFEAWVPVNALNKVVGGTGAWSKQDRLLMAATIYEMFREVFRSHADEQTWRVMKQTVQPTGQVRRQS